MCLYNEEMMLQYNHLLYYVYMYDTINIYIYINLIIHLFLYRDMLVIWDTDCLLHKYFIGNWDTTLSCCHTGGKDIFQGQQVGIHANQLTIDMGLVKAKLQRKDYALMLRYVGETWKREKDDNAAQNW